MKNKLIDYWRKGKIITDERAIEAFKKVKRENFILKNFKKQAYEDTPLPIMEEQTISQPTTVMIMTQALEVKEGNKILEIGSGSGYQAAILSHLVGSKGKVITIERIKELGEFAKKNLEKEGIKNVKVIMGDGSLGYGKEKPYDRIIVTAASPKIPEKLLEQLKENGIMVVPVGHLHNQEMLKIKKSKGKLDIKNLGDFIFVPLKGEEGY